MIVVNCALKQTDIVKVVEDIELDNMKVFKFVKKEGIKLYFESTLEDDEKAVAIIKKAIKSAKFGSALLFNVLSE